MGGNGKTSLAREVAFQCLQDEGHAPRFDAVVLVSDKDNPGTTNHSTVLDTIARTLGYPGFTQLAHDEKQYEVEHMLRRQKVLLIIDNAETITDGALDFIKICFDFRTAFCVSAKFGSYAARNMFP